MIPVESYLDGIAFFLVKIHKMNLGLKYEICDETVTCEAEEFKKILFN